MDDLFFIDRNGHTIEPAFLINARISAKEMVSETLLASNNDIAAEELTNDFGKTIPRYVNNRLGFRDEDGASTGYTETCVLRETSPIR